jgi:hypothetical protein
MHAAQEPFWHLTSGEEQQSASDVQHSPSFWQYPGRSWHSVAGLALPLLEAFVSMRLPQPPAALRTTNRTEQGIA